MNSRNDIIMNHISRVLIYMLIGIGTTLILLPVRYFPSFYDVRYMGIGELTGGLLALLLPRAIRVSAHVSQATQKNHAADTLKFMIALVFAGNMFGDLGMYQLYRIGIPFDKLLHLVLPIVAVYAVAHVLHDRFGVRSVYAFISATLFVIACGICWEIIEHYSDLFLGTHMSGKYGLDTFHDTRADLLCDITGASIGLLLTAYRSRFTMRIRHPLQRQLSKT